MPCQPNEQAARFLGLDLAWKAKNPSGLAALDEAGHLLDLRTDLCEDDAILDWIARWRGSWGAIAIDMPTIVRNAMGQRPCERDLRRDFRTYDAGPYPANRSLEPFRNGGRAAELLTKLAELGVVHACDVAPSDPRTVAFEVFPHPALIRLFGLDRVLLYKNKYPRTWTSVLDAWAEYRRLLGTLERADPPLVLSANVPTMLDPAIKRKDYKQWDDALDGICCAYVASWVWHHGTRPPHVRVYGEMEHGHIVVPDRVALPA